MAKPPSPMRFALLASVEGTLERANLLFHILINKYVRIYNELKKIEQYGFVPSTACGRRWPERPDEGAPRLNLPHYFAWEDANLKDRPLFQLTYVIQLKEVVC